MYNRLINLITQAEQICMGKITCNKCEYYGKGSMCQTLLCVDHLIKNDVVVQSEGEWV